MSRKRGQRNWEEELPYTLHQTPVKKNDKKQERLTIEELTASPPSYEVSDGHHRTWVVSMAADGSFEVIDKPEGVYYNMEVRILRAVTRYHGRKG